ncbi:MAG: VanZ family protein [Phycisphaerae bacterium]
MVSAGKARRSAVLAGRLWIVYWVAFFAIMHTPRQHLPHVRVSYIDKVAHVTGYALLGLLGGAYAQRAGVKRGKAWYAKWLLVYALYAAVDELTQPYVNRSANLSDWVADVIGVVIAFVVVRLDNPRT